MYTYGGVALNYRKTVVAKEPLKARAVQKGNIDVMIASSNEASHYCEVLYPIIPSGISPSVGIGPTQGQRKTLTMVGFEPTTFGLDHRCSTD